MTKAVISLEQPQMRFRGVCVCVRTQDEDTERVYQLRDTSSLSKKWLKEVADVCLFPHKPFGLGEAETCLDVSCRGIFQRFFLTSFIQLLHRRLLHQCNKIRPFNLFLDVVWCWCCSLTLVLVMLLWILYHLFSIILVHHIFCHDNFPLVFCLTLIAWSWEKNYVVQCFFISILMFLFF